DLSDINNQIEELSIRHQSNQATLATERNLFALAKAEVDRLVKLQQQNLSNESAVNNARSTLGKQQLAVLSRQLEVESYPAKLEILKARRDFNRAKVAESSLAMERAQMKAPFDAVISQVFVADGDRVMLGQSLLSLFPLSSLEIRAHLPTAYVDQIRQAMSGGVTLTAGIEKRDELGKFILTRIAGRAETSGIDVYFKAQDTNSQLRPGELLPLSLHLPEMDNVIAIPYQAIYGNSVVYLMRQGRMQAIEVSSVGQQVNIEGQRILLIRSESIESGDHIIVTHLPNAVSGLKVTSSENATNN
ncbi:MAG: HlyD family secretion protein, partial [Gammaproteobacteria bacterium]